MNLQDLQALVPNSTLLPRSLHHANGSSFVLLKRGADKYLFIAPQHADFQGEPLADGVLCPLSNHNARLIREMFPHTAPQPIGRKPSFGAGDRLGLAGAAHIRAARKAGEADFALILAQQSMREMARTQRTPEEVLDAATWAAFEEDFTQPWGADADHLKSEDDVRLMARAGFTFFTIDPSEHVDAQADRYGQDALKDGFEALPDSAELSEIYFDQSFQIPETPDCAAFLIQFTPEILWRAGVKYARAIAHTQRLAQVLGEEKEDSDLEMSVDETDAPTSIEEHFFIAHELKRRGVVVHSLALRFVGEFQKGIDYKGDLGEFEARLKQHVAIARHLGPYKISIHSGSDKFSIFPIAARVCKNLLHEKTAGTWYLEALRVAARFEPGLFREILLFAHVKFPTERATYHVTESLDALPDLQVFVDADLETILDMDEGRQMLHVTFGSVLTEENTELNRGRFVFRERLYDLWRRREEEHLQIVAEHSLRHMQALGLGERSMNILNESQVRQIVEQATQNLDLDNKKVLIIIPDSTRTAPVGLLFRALFDAIGARVQLFDLLIALGTHQPMSEAAINARLEISELERGGKYAKARVFNHAWDDEEQLQRIGSISRDEIRELSEGRFEIEIPVTINKRVGEYDQIVIIGPVFPHEVVGFSGGNKYLFPGVSGPEVLNFFHWLAALVTNPRTIGHKPTRVREVINRAASLVTQPKLAFCMVVEPGSTRLNGLFAGTPEEAWSQAADLSAQVHIVRKPRAFGQVLSCAPTMYADLWTGGKCMYKLEPVVEDGGELIIYAPHISEVSVTHGRLIEEIGYHTRDYFTSQWSRFEHLPWGVLAHSTHVRGVGAMENGIEKPRITVTLATQISRQMCEKINMSWRDPASIDVESFAEREDEGILLVRKAGEMLFQLQDPPDWARA